MRVGSAACSAVSGVFKFVTAANAVLSLLSGSGGNSGSGTGGTDTTRGTAGNDTTGPLKSANSFILGMAVEYSQMTAATPFAAIVGREANGVTFGNELKYGSIVQNNGSFNYATADALADDIERHLAGQVVRARPDSMPQAWAIASRT